MKELDIVTLDNFKDYVIVSSLKHNNRRYLLLVNVDKNENLLEEKLILEEVDIEGFCTLKEIDNDLTNKVVCEKFAKLLLNYVNLY